MIMPKETRFIQKDEGMYCTNCNMRVYGKPESIRKNHKCKKIKVKRKYFLFGKKIAIPQNIKGEPKLITLKQYEMMKIERNKEKTSKKLSN